MTEFSVHTFTMNNTTPPQQLNPSGDIPQKLVIKANAAGFFIGGYDLTSDSAATTGFPMIVGKEYEFTLGPQGMGDEAPQSVWLVTTSASDVTFSFIVYAG